MLKKFEDGFIAFDLLLSLSCLIIITSFFLPFLQDIIINFQNSDMRLLAEKTLYDEILLKKENEAFPQIYTVQTDENEYHLNFEIEKKHLVGCIEWFNAKTNLESMCHYVPNFITK